MQDKLLTHMRKFYGDRHIVEDLDAVLAVCETEDDEIAVRRYARLRKSADDFRPGDFLHNNHRNISPDVLVGKVATNVCVQDGKPFVAQRSTAQFCSARCRQAHKRSRG